MSAPRVGLFAVAPERVNGRALAMLRSLRGAGYRVTLFSTPEGARLAPEGVEAEACLAVNGQGGQERVRLAQVPDLSGFDVLQVAGRGLFAEVARHAPETARLIYDVPCAEGPSAARPGDGIAARGLGWLAGLRTSVGAWRSAPAIDAVVCPSYVFGEYLQRELKLGAVPVVPIYPALPLVEAVTPDPTYWGRKGRPAVVVLGGDFAAAEPAVRGVGRLRDVDLVIVNGHGDWEALERVASEFPRMAGRLHRIGVPEDALLGTLVNFRVGLVLPTDTSQQALYDIPPALFTLVMAGLPVVASDLPGIERLVAAHNFGLLANPGDFEQVADQVGRTLNDVAAYERLRHNVDVVRRQRYAWEVQEKRLLALYAQLAGAAVPRRAAV
ncbi:MAG: glycosyltransferase family 4 protein [Nitrospirae bacterium]|nr:glycosyltransferase family 4 protein [Nitrospirota bacterium]